MRRRLVALVTLVTLTACGQSHPQPSKAVLAEAARQHALVKEIKLALDAAQSTHGHPMTTQEREGLVGYQFKVRATASFLGDVMTITAADRSCSTELSPGSPDRTTCHGIEIDDGSSVP